jgi:predicted SAM-dependent methyltransferase
VRFFRRAAVDRLNIGCGRHPLEGWTNLDSQRLPGVDRVVDVRKRLPYRGVSFIFAEHFIEHLPLQAGLRFLVRCRRALAPDGVLRLSTPNLAWVMATHHRPEDSVPPEQGLEDCLRTNLAFRGWGHEFLYNRAALTLALRSSGFDAVSFHEYGESPHPELRGIEGHVRSEDYPGLPHVLVAEAQGTTRPARLPELLVSEFCRDIESR